MVHLFLKKSHLNLFLVLLIILYSAKSLPFLLNILPLGLILIVAFVIYFLQNKRLSINYKGRVPFIVFFILMVLYIFKYKEIDPVFIGYYFTLITVTFLAINLLGFNFFIYYEKIVFKLAVLSLFLYGAQLMFGDFLFESMRTISDNVLSLNSSGKYATIVLYTINPDNTFPIRNCGFAWEPGPYAVFLSLAIWIRLLENNFRLDKHIWVMLIAIITTFSTTGYLAVMTLFGWFLYNKKGTAYALLPILTLLFMFIFVKTPFLKDKIFEEYNNAGQYLDKAIKSDKPKNVSIGRFPGFLLNIRDFKKNPILGYGGHVAEETEAYRLGVKITSTSGLGNWIARFGIVGIIILIVTYYHSVRKLLSINNSRGAVFLWGLLLILAFGFNLLNSFMFFAFMLFSSFNNETSIDKESIIV